jgi:hypothetical protein
MPVPAPATARLLGRAPYYGGDVQGELVTPTGAALLTQTARRFGAMPLLRGQAIGYGAGTRDLEDRPNVVRVVIGEAEEALPGTEPILVVESNMDDMNPEMYPPLLEALLEAGAREAFITPIVGKKGRPAHLVTALCHEPALAEVAQALFANSTTLGLRMRRDERICLEREWRDVNTPFGVVPVKLSKRGGRFTRPMPEFEDCRRLAAEHGVGVMTVYEAAREAAAREEAPHE